MLRWFMSSPAPMIDASLERLVRHVVEAMRPLEVWLFGSRAENRARPTSDYDLLVVMPDARSMSVEKRVAARSRWPENNFSVPLPIAELLQSSRPDEPVGIALGRR